MCTRKIVVSIIIRSRFNAIGALSGCNQLFNEHVGTESLPLNIAMADLRDQRYAIKSRGRLQRTATQTFEESTTVFGDATMSERTCFRRRGSFRNCRESFESKGGDGAPATSAYWTDRQHCRRDDSNRSSLNGETANTNVRHMRRRRSSDLTRPLARVLRAREMRTAFIDTGTKT